MNVVIYIKNILFYSILYQKFESAEQIWKKILRFHKPIIISVSKVNISSQVEISIQTKKLEYSHNLILPKLCILTLQQNTFKTQKNQTTSASYSLEMHFSRLLSQTTMPNPLRKSTCLKVDGWVSSQK